MVSSVLLGLFVAATHVAGLPPGYEPPPFQTVEPASALSTARYMWDTVGNLLTTSDYFPFEVNVPDTISEIASSLSHAWDSMSSHIPKMLWHRLEQMAALFSP